MNAYETNEVRALTAAELEGVFGGSPWWQEILWGVIGNAIYDAITGPPMWCPYLDPDKKTDPCK
jgi:hypothetical protein